MLISSSKTRKAKEKLDNIASQLLKNFLNKRKNFKSVQNVISKSESQKLSSSIHRFAISLTEKKNMKLFKEAIDLQSKSLGTSTNGLFNKLIYPIKDGWWDSQSKSKIRAFLLAKEDTDIVDEGVNKEDKKFRRKKNSDIIAKLKSNRLSNILKVFIALVMWNYIIIKEQESNLEEYLYNKDSSGNFMPSPRDIVQVAGGNCYMLGVLISLAEKDPEFIKNKLIKIKNNTIFISLYDFQNETQEKNVICKPNRKVKIQLSKEKIENSDITKTMNKHKAKWVYAVEIAFNYLFEQYHKERCEPNSPYTVLMKGGHSFEVITVLTGKKSKANIIPEFNDRKRDRPNLKKFPEGAKYDPYSIKIRDRILKHLKKPKNTSGLIVASFDKISSPNVSKSLLYKMFKEDSKLLTKFKEFFSHRLWLLTHIKIIDGEISFSDSNLFRKEVVNIIKPHLINHINDPEYENFKKQLDGDNAKIYDLKFMLETYETWSPPIIKEFRGSTHCRLLCEEFKELMTNKISFAESKYFDYYLKNEIVPYLSKSLRGSESEEFRTKMDIVSDHSYAVLNCFEDKETGYWYVTLQNPHGLKTKIDYSKSQRLKIPPDPKPGSENVFNMELAHFCKYLKGLSYDYDK